MNLTLSLIISKAIQLVGLIHKNKVRFWIQITVVINNELFNINWKALKFSSSSYNTWEPEENISPYLISKYEQETVSNRPERLSNELNQTKRPEKIIGLARSASNQVMFIMKWSDQSSSLLFSNTAIKSFLTHVKQFYNETYLFADENSKSH